MHLYKCVNQVVQIVKGPCTNELMRQCEPENYPSKEEALICAMRQR